MPAADPCNGAGHGDEHPGLHDGTGGFRSADDLGDDERERYHFHAYYAGGFAVRWKGGGGKGLALVRNSLGWVAAVGGGGRYRGTDRRGRSTMQQGYTK